VRIADDPDLERDLAPLELRAGESELHGWSAPGGHGLLTNQRCLLLSHPHPIHRVVRWSVDLENISALSVQPVRGLPDRQIAVTGTFGGGVISTPSIDPAFSVLVNENEVFIGDPTECADLQQRIDEARTSRCVAICGRLLPYNGAGVGARVPRSTSDVAAPRASPSAGLPGGLGAPFVMFIAGEPFRDAVPGARHPMVTGLIVRGTVGPSEGIGGHAPADADPGQVYGPQAREARLVLDIAQKCNVTVKVVDVDDSGADASLVERYVSANDALPCLIRPDGARLTGSESFVPPRVAAFLQGR
jgi:hypothetical protein